MHELKMEEQIIRTSTYTHGYEDAFMLSYQFHCDAVLGALVYPQVEETFL